MGDILDDGGEFVDFARKADKLLHAAGHGAHRVFQQIHIPHQGGDAFISGCGDATAFLRALGGVLGIA